MLRVTRPYFLHSVKLSRVPEATMASFSNADERLSPIMEPVFLKTSDVLECSFYVSVK